VGNRKADITLFSTADWDNPFWTNKQHVAKEFASQGHRVLYIESIGLRAPTATASDAKRILRRLKKALSLPSKIVIDEGNHHRELATNAGAVWVLSPLVIPLQRFAFVRLFNRILLQTTVSLAQKWIGINRDWLWTYNPLTLDFLYTNKYQKLVYHCVDAIEQQPGMPLEKLVSSEEQLSKRCDFVFCTSKALLARHEAWNKNAYYFGNVADEHHFSSAKRDDTFIPEEISKLREVGAVLGFVGAISSYKQNFDLIAQLAEANESWQIVLIGKVGEGDPTDNADRIASYANVHLLGPREYSTLPNYIKGFDVCLLPTELNEYTRNMFPMKFYEYLMAGKDVVAMNIDSLAGLEPFYFPAENSADFISQVDSVLSGCSCQKNAGLEEHLAQNTYRARNKKMIDLIINSN